MGKTASAGDLEQLDSVKAPPSMKFEMDEGRAEKQHRLLERERRALTWLWRRAPRCWQWLRGYFWHVPMWLEDRWRFLRTWRIVLIVHLSANPIVSILAMTALFIILACLVVAAFLRPASGDPFTFLVRVAADGVKAWKVAIDVELLDGRKKSPIGDYLAFQVIISFLTGMGEYWLRRDSIVVRDVSRQKGGWSVRGMLIVIILLTNLVVTVLISYGFLYPIPRGPIGLIYVGLAGFMLAAGVVRLLSGIFGTFPLRPRMLRKSIESRRRRVAKLNKTHQCRKLNSGRRCRGVSESTIVPQSRYLSAICRSISRKSCLSLPRSNLLRRACEFRISEPHHKLLHQIFVVFLVRIGIGVLFNVLAFLVFVFVHQWMYLMDLSAQWAAWLVVWGLFSSLFISWGAFRLDSEVGWVMGTYCIVFGVIMYSLFVSIRYELIIEGGSSVLRLIVEAVAAVLLLFTEVFCIFLTFEMRNFTLVSIVREKRVLAEEIYVLQKYLHHKWPRECGAPHGVMGRGKQRASLCRLSTKMSRTRKIN